MNKVDSHQLVEGAAKWFDVEEARIAAERDRIIAGANQMMMDAVLTWSEKWKDISEAYDEMMREAERVREREFSEAMRA